ncbi:MAG: DUF2752 domain-containing protein [Clostridia bacterium]|nr:DUF2752 domain-containing protein [Clostridia bacterium]
MKKILPILLVVIIVAVFLVFSDQSICVFKKVTGIPCPSCGMTRAFLFLLQGDIENAFILHPLFLLVPVTFIVMLYSYFTKKPCTKIFIAIIVIFILVYMIRMILFFPHDFPMEYDQNNLIYRLFK